MSSKSWVEMSPEMTHCSPGRNCINFEKLSAFNADLFQNVVFCT